MIAWAAPALAGAWTKELGEAYVKGHGDLYLTRRLEAQGVDQGGSYVGQQYGVYAEVGVLPGWKGQIVAALPVVLGTHHGEYVDPFGTREVRATTLRGGDLRLGAQVALHPRLPLALALDVKIPTYANGSVGGSYPLYRHLFPKPGDGQVDLGATLLAGVSPWKDGFAELAIGAVHRTEWFVGWDTSLELRDGLRLGAKVGHRVRTVLPIVAVEALLSPDPTPATRSFVAAAASALIDVGVGVALEPRLTADLWTDHTSQGWGGGLGVSYRR